LQLEITGDDSNALAAAAADRAGLRAVPGFSNVSTSASWCSPNSSCARDPSAPRAGA
jgi:hypothetical protein